MARKIVENGIFEEFVHEIMRHPNEDALIAGLQSNPCTPLSKESKQMVHAQGKVETSNCAKSLTQLDVLIV